jgi:hypothetical protein
VSQYLSISVGHPGFDKTYSFFRLDPLPVYDDFLARSRRQKVYFNVNGNQPVFFRKLAVGGPIGGGIDCRRVYAAMNAAEWIHVYGLEG